MADNSFREAEHKMPKPIGMHIQDWFNSLSLKGKIAVLLVAALVVLGFIGSLFSGFSSTAAAPSLAPPDVQPTASPQKNPDFGLWIWLFLIAFLAFIIFLKPQPRQRSPEEEVTYRRRIAELEAEEDFRKRPRFRF